jgi:hypothetical protein
MGEVFEVGLEFRGQKWESVARGLQAFSEDLGKSFDKAGEVLNAEVRGYLENVAKAIRKRNGFPWPMGTSANTLSARSGALIQSIEDSIGVTGTTPSTVQGTIGSKLPYARIQEYGGTIVPKNGKYLAIPLDAALNQQGIPLRPGPRFWTNTFVAKSKAGNLLIFQKRGAGIIPLYVLKTSVTLPARLGLGATVRSQIPFFQERAINQMLKSMRESF